MNKALGILLICLFQTISLQWNYNNQGKDWVDIGSCNPRWFKEQSPINIDQTKVISEPTNTLFIKPINVDVYSQMKEVDQTLKSNGYFLRMLGADEQGNHRTYNSQQFHFHAPAEHTIDNKYYPLEMHVVCQETIKSRFNNPYSKRIFAVFGVWFETSPFWEVFNVNKRNQLLKYNFYDAIYSSLKELEKKNALEFFYYPGSLTTPGCNEAVNFYILKEPLSITSQQLKVFQDMWQNNKTFANGNGNNRVIMDLNNRQVKKGKIVMKDTMETLNSNILTMLGLIGVLILSILI